MVDVLLTTGMEWETEMFCDQCDIIQPCNMFTVDGDVHGYCLICGAPVDEDTIYDGKEGTELDAADEFLSMFADGYPDAGGWD